MSNESMKINVPEMAARPADLAGWEKFWTAAERVEVFNRYCDVKDREKKYRVESADKLKRLKAYAKEHGIEV